MASRPLSQSTAAGWTSLTTLTSQLLGLSHTPAVAIGTGIGTGIRRPCNPVNVAQRGIKETVLLAIKLFGFSLLLVIAFGNLLCLPHAASINCPAHTRTIPKIRSAVPGPLYRLALLHVAVLLFFVAHVGIIFLYSDDNSWLWFEMSAQAL
jgi:hypothetical protein